MSDPDVRRVRSVISIRGLEQFSSKRLHRALWALQADHRAAVLTAQDQHRELLGGYPSLTTKNLMADELAWISHDKSRSSRERAARQGKEDEAAVLSYIARSSSAAIHGINGFRPSRRQSMPSAPTPTISPSPSSSSSDLGQMQRVRSSTELLRRSASSLTTSSSRRNSLSFSGKSATFDSIVLPPAAKPSMGTMAALLEPFPSEPRSRRKST
jgi:hypothetical protein